MKQAVGAIAIIISSIFTNSAIAKPAKYPMPLIWDVQIKPQLREKLLQSPKLKADLQVAYDGYIENQCYGLDDYKTCLANPPKPPFAEVFDALTIATPDLNNDGKRDLIIILGSATGLSGNGHCGIDQYWFYENIGNDYRNIGKSEFLRVHQFYLGPPMPKGKFRDIITKEVDDFCDGDKPPQFESQKYDYKKRAYFDLKIEYQ